MQRILKIDWILLASVFLLLSMGLIVLYSISTAGEGFGSSVFIKQCIFSLLGLAATVFFIFFDYQYFKSYSTFIYFVMLLILVSVLLFGQTNRGTSGWIGLGAFHVQPVELAKVALIISLASFFSTKKAKLGELSGLIGSLVLTAIVVFLVILQPDFGSAMIISGIWLGMTFFSGIKKKYFIAIILAGVIFSSSGWFFLADYQKQRIVNFVNPESDPQGSGYNVIQSMIAVGSGGLIGKGIGHGSQSQLNFLPEKHTDFIFAVITEELGYLGSVVMMFLFGVVFYRIKKIAESAQDNFGYLIATGAMVMLFLQILINVGMNIGVMPVTGIPLPFLSYGGSSLLSMMALLGILMNIHLKRNKTSEFKVLQTY